MNATLRNPAVTFRVLLVAGIFAVPGGLAGAMISFWIGEFALCALAGLLIGALCGGLLEAWQPGANAESASDDCHQDADDAFGNEHGYLAFERENANRC